MLSWTYYTKRYSTTGLKVSKSHHFGENFVMCFFVGALLTTLSERLTLVASSQCPEPYAQENSRIPCKFCEGWLISGFRFRNFERISINFNIFTSKHKYNFGFKVAFENVFWFRWLFFTSAFTLVNPSYKHFLLNDLGLGVVTRLKNFVVA